MGLDFSHCNARWDYIGFGRFRHRIATACGYQGKWLYDDFGKSVELGKYCEDISPFITHSDCDGELTPDEMKKIWPILEHAIKLWDDNDYDKKQGLELIDGMKLAISKNENLEFI